MGKIIWIASYPKSGNTWMRVFLETYLDNPNAPLNINRLRSDIACKRNLFDEYVGVEASNLTQDEIEGLRPGVHRLIAEESTQDILVKIHDALTYNTAGTPIIAQDATRCAIYILRNPLDVAVSMAHFFPAPVDEIINKMRLKNARLDGDEDTIRGWLSERLLSWSEHVESWSDQDLVPVQVVRYEDMLLQPQETFSRVIRSLGMPLDLPRLDRAIQFSSFDVLKSQEKEHGFLENTPTNREFFRSGKIGAWRTELTETQCQQIILDHRKIMERFAYLDQNGEILL
jgi:hypothetical protein